MKLLLGVLMLQFMYPGERFQEMQYVCCRGKCYVKKDGSCVVGFIADMDVSLAVLCG
jgi:hypothetical protein